MERSQARLRPSLGVSVVSRVRELGVWVCACVYAHVLHDPCQGCVGGGHPPDARSRIGLSVKC